jgi:hypothetical protein
MLRLAAATIGFAGATDRFGCGLAWDQAGHEEAIEIASETAIARIVPSTRLPVNTQPA